MRCLLVYLFVSVYFGLVNLFLNKSLLSNLYLFDY